MRFYITRTFENMLFFMHPREPTFGWTTEPSRAMYFDTRSEADIYLTRRQHSGVGVEVRPL